MATKTPEKELKALFHLTDGSVIDTYMTEEALQNFAYMLPPTITLNNKIIMTAQLLYIETFAITTKVLQPEEEKESTASYIGSN